MNRSLFCPKSHEHTLNLSNSPININEILKLEKTEDTLLKSINLISQFPPVYDQGSLGSCTANALCSLFAYRNKEYLGSRLFLYYNERVIKNNVRIDSGSELRDGIKVLETLGLCKETDWPYDVIHFYIKPLSRCYSNALDNKVTSAHQIPQYEQSFKTALINGDPFTSGIMIYDSFETQQVVSNGIVPMPNVTTERCLGGHAVVCVGFTTIDEQEYWVMRNSRGSKWGDHGYFYLPLAYLLTSDLAKDFWTIQI
jgi:C1A family cysteine protease